MLATLEQLRETVHNLEKRTQFLTKQAQAHLNEAAALKATDKPAALLEMKRHVLKMKEVEGLINTQASLEAQMLALESASITSGVVSSVQAGHKTQKALAKNLDPEAVAQLQENVSEQMDALNEVNRTLGLQLGDPMDDAELMRQLDELTATTTPMPATAAAPVVVVVGALDDSEQLRALEADILGSLPAVPALVPMPVVPTAAPGKSPTHVGDKDDDDETLAALAREMEM